MAALDDFMSNLLQNPNFYNPLYASHEQKKRQEDYAAMLAKRSTEGATRPTGVLAAMIDQLTSNIYRNASLNQEQAQYGDLQRRQEIQNRETQGGGGGGGVAANNADLEQPPPQSVATSGVVPKTLDQQRIAMLRGETGFNADGTPTLNVSASPPGAPIRTASLNPSGPAGAGVPPPPPGAPAARPVLPTGPAAAAPPTFNERYAQARSQGPGYGGTYNPANNAALQINPMATEQQRNVAAGIFKPEMGLDLNGMPITVSPGGGMQATPVGRGVIPGLQRTTTFGPEGGTLTYGQPAPGYGGGTPGVGGAIQQMLPLQEYSRGQHAESLRTGGGAKGEAANIEFNVTQANTAREGIKNAGTMEDLIRSNPNQVFGPAAKSTNEFLRFVQSIPGVGASVDAKTLAASDGIEKLNLALAGSLQAKLGLNPSSIGLSMLSSPGNEKSYQGTLDLLGLVKQGFVRDHYIATTLYKQARDLGRLAEYPQMIDDYIHNNPIKQPNTGHLIMDPVPIQNPADEKRLGLKKGTPVILPDGRHGWVP